MGQQSGLFGFEVFDLAKLVIVNPRWTILRLRAFSLQHLPVSLSDESLTFLMPDVSSTLSRGV